MVVADVAFDRELLRGEQTEVAHEQPFRKEQPWVYLVAGHGIGNRLYAKLRDVAYSIVGMTVRDIDLIRHGVRALELIRVREQPPRAAGSPLRQLSKRSPLLIGSPVVHERDRLATPFMDWCGPGGGD